MTRKVNTLMWVALMAALVFAVACSDDDVTNPDTDGGVTDGKVQPKDGKIQTDEGNLSDKSVAKPDQAVNPFPNCPQPVGDVNCVAGQVKAKQVSPTLKWQDKDCEEILMLTKKDSPKLPEVDYTFLRTSCTGPTGAAL